jgi:elongation factor P
MAESIQATALRKGTAVLFEGVPYRVLTFEHRTQGRKSGFVQVKLRNLLDGTQREVKLASTDSVERARIETAEMDYLYADGADCVFMDTSTYEQISVPSADLPDVIPWLVDGMRVSVETLEGKPIGVQLPKVVEMRVQEAEPVVKGQTAARSNKPATLSNGIVVQVPQFINTGDRVRVDPGERRYIERVK